MSDDTMMTELLDAQYADDLRRLEIAITGLRMTRYGFGVAMNRTPALADELHQMADAVVMQCDYRAGRLLEVLAARKVAI